MKSSGREFSVEWLRVSGIAIAAIRLPINDISDNHPFSSLNTVPFPFLFLIALVKPGQYGGDAADQERGRLHQRGAGQGAGGPQAQLPAAGPSAHAPAPPSQHPLAPWPQSSPAAGAAQAGREHEAAAGCDQHAHHRGAARL